MLLNGVGVEDLRLIHFSLPLCFLIIQVHIFHKRYVLIGYQISIKILSQLKWIVQTHHCTLFSTLNNVFSIYFIQIYTCSILYITPVVWRKSLRGLLAFRMSVDNWVLDVFNIVYVINRYPKRLINTILFLHYCTIQICIILLESRLIGLLKWLALSIRILNSRYLLGRFIFGELRIQMVGTYVSVNILISFFILTTFIFIVILIILNWRIVR